MDWYDSLYIKLFRREQFQLSFGGLRPFQHHQEPVKKVKIGPEEGPGFYAISPIISRMPVLEGLIMIRWTRVIGKQLWESKPQWS
jgi:hypothetical protein